MGDGQAELALENGSSIAYDGDGETPLEGVNEVWLGEQSVAGDEFIAALNAVSEMQAHLREFRGELDDMDTGLDRQDAIDLLWGRTSLNKGQIRTAFEVMDAIVEEDPQDIVPRLLADQTSELTIAEAANVWDDLVNLAEKYGSLNAQTDDSENA